MHNKLWIADNAVAILGGRVADISRSFDAYWNSKWAVPIAAFPGQRPKAEDLERALADMAQRAAQFRDTDYARALRESELASAVRTWNMPLVQAPARILDDPPERLDSPPPVAPSRIFVALGEAVRSAQREVIIITPYFIPGDPGVAILTALVRRGVKVRVLTNSLSSTDVAIVHAGYARYRASLLAGGVALYERKVAAGTSLTARFGLSSGASLHAKAVVVDRRVVLAGSMNLDPRSRASNTEVAVLIDSAEIGGQLAQLFDDSTTLEQAYRVELAAPGNADSALTWTIQDSGAVTRYTSEPQVSWWRRIWVGLLGALAPEELL